MVDGKDRKLRMMVDRKRQEGQKYRCNSAILQWSLATTTRHHIMRPSAPNPQSTCINYEFEFDMMI